ncbi:MAG TPA: LytTR family DNA-binding domain-containing protein [Usitatibacteraceae bacterium]|nr:LytTR family DNA-binding domain-containing protein [Usitatibacteraceae bacterium]
MSRILIAEDEPLMRERLLAQLQVAWPDGEVVAVAKDGLQALEQWRQLRPQVAFLDIRMPGKSGLEVAAEIGDQAHVVFVTAYDEYAIPAFEQGAVDYLVKPVEPERLAVAVQRIQKRIGAAPPDWSAVVAGLLNRGQPASKLKWIRASLGNQTRVIDVADVLFFQSDAKYTRIVLRDSEALVRTPLKELVEGLDPESFWQVHRGTIVNVAAIDRAVREGPEKLVLHLKGCAEKLGVSRQYFHLFRQG